MPTFTPNFRRLAITAASLIYLLMIMGSVVRTSESGLGCPDWPLCHGQIVPPMEIHAIIEYTHRLVALAASLSIVAVTALAFVHYRRVARIAAPASIMMTLLAIQIPLGGVVVVSELAPLMVAVHLGVALLILGCAMAIAVAATLTPYPPRPVGEGESYDDDLKFDISNLKLILPATLIALFGLLLTGALVVGSEATLACIGWPLCSGRAMPGPNDSPLIAIHLLHRYMVGIISLLIVALVAIILRAGDMPLRKWAIWLGMLFAAQVAVGAAQALTLFPAWLRTLHLATGTAVWEALVGMGVTAYLSRRS